jgi:hypothetical protein
MGQMTTRLHLHLAALSAAIAGFALLPGVASAQTVELGATTTPLTAPACVKGQPLSQCTIVLTHTTAVEATSDGVINPTRVNQQGWIVAFTVGLSRLSSSRSTEASIIKSQDAQHGGAPELALTVLKPGPRNSFTVEGESALYTLTPFLGQVLQEPLSLPPSFTSLTALHVVRGDVIGLTVPTWAPVLGYDLSKTMFSYRQSRRANCANTAASQTAQTRAGQVQTYGCYYTGTRVEYSATEVTDTKPPKSYVGDSTARR